MILKFENPSQQVGSALLIDIFHGAVCNFTVNVFGKIHKLISIKRIFALKVTLFS